MNKTWKSLVALIAGGALAMSGMVGVSSALAIDGTVADNKSTTNTTNAKIYDANATLTINNVVQGDEFSGYQLLFLDSESEAGKVYLVNDVYRDAIKAGIKAVLGDGYNADNFNTDAKIISWLTTNLTGGTLNDGGTVTMADITNIDKFTAGFMGARPAPAATFTTNAENLVEEGNQVQKEVPVGFYLIEHTAVGESTTTGRTTSKYMAMNVSALEGASNTINLKNGTVTLDKTITNPTDGDADGDGKAKGSSYNVGDTVNYELTGKLPDNFADYTNFFYYTFTDVLSAGLTPPAASKVTVKIDNTPVTLPEGSVKWEDEGDDGAHKLTVAMGDLKTATFPGVTITKDSVIKVTYTATVNENAVITNAGNPNTAKVSFTRSPSSTEEGDTADTPEDKTTVYTFQLTLNKVDNKNKPLKGAEFTLYKEDGTTAIGDPVSADKVLDLDGETVSSYTANFKGLAAGTYVIKETKTPAGYNTIDDITIKVVATYNTDGSIASLSVTDANGNAINGFTATVDSGVISSAIVNNPGSVLPSTGGMGTVLLYTVGGLVVLIAAAGLTIALKRRQN